MSALPADIARWTTDGVVLFTPPATTGIIIKGVHPAARTPASEFPTFFDNAADALTMLNEKFGYIGEVSPVHLAIEFKDTIDIGGSLPIGPTVPCFQIYDDDHSVNTVARCLSYAHDFATDSYAIEVLG